MKVKVFMPEYMVDFKCISSQCIDTCCAGWDINIDEDTYNNYISSTGKLKKLLKNKFIENKNEHDFFNKGFMVLKDENTCPFLNENKLCDIHGNIGEEKLCITCKSYPRVYNLIDDVYEKSALASCYEICVKALLNKEKMEFIEIEEEINESQVEIRRIIDTEAFDGSESLIQYFWDIRVISINIIQNRKYSLEERLIILKEFYNKLEKLKEQDSFEEIEELLYELNEENIEWNFSDERAIEIDNNFYKELFNDNLMKNIRSTRLKECVNEYKEGIFLIENLPNYLKKNTIYLEEFKTYYYILENYLVNQIFKDLVPFNKGESLIASVNVLINTYKIIKAYTIGIAINSNKGINDKSILRVIQSLSKDIEHNKVYKEILES